MLFGRRRVESDRWAIFRPHYGFESFYCTPAAVAPTRRAGSKARSDGSGDAGGGIAGRANTRLAEFDRRDDQRRVTGRPQIVGHDLAVEDRVLLPLPAERFETGLTLSPRVDRHARITVRQCRYSVPAKLIGRQVRVLLRATELLVFDGHLQVAVHVRATVRGGGPQPRSRL